MPEPSRIFDCVVVGGGIAGLSAAAFLSKAGSSVLLCERNESFGGLASTISRSGFVFDTGLRAIEDAGIVKPLLASLGLSLDFLPSPVSIGIEDRSIRLGTGESLEDYRKLLAGLYPENVADVDRIIDELRRVMGFMSVLYGIENPGFRDLAHDREYVMKTLLPWTLKFLGTARKIAKMNVPVEGYLDRLSGNQSLKDIIGQHFFRETPAFFALSYFSLYLDYLYPRGGTGQLARVLSDYLERSGCELRTGCRIEAVLPSSRLAHTSSGEYLGYRHLVWAADQKALYTSLDPVDLAALPGRVGVLARTEVERRRDLISHKRGGDSVFSLFLSVDRPPEDFSAVSTGHFFYTPERTGARSTPQGGARGAAPRPSRLCRPRGQGGGPRLGRALSRTHDIRNFHPRPSRSRHGASRQDRSHREQPFRLRHLRARRPRGLARGVQEASRRTDDRGTGAAALSLAAGRDHRQFCSGSSIARTADGQHRRGPHGLVLP